MTQHGKPSDEDWQRFFDHRDTIETALVKVHAHLDDLRDELGELKRRVVRLECNKTS